MKYRKSKIKMQHSIIRGLREHLESISDWEEIEAIIPGRISKVRSLSTRVVMRTKDETITGLRCAAHSGTAIQEVFIVTKEKEKVKKRLEDMQPVP
jgi:hypothetical protein